MLTHLWRQTQPTWLDKLLEFKFISREAFKGWFAILKYRTSKSRGQKGIPIVLVTWPAEYLPGDRSHTLTMRWMLCVYLSCLSTLGLFSFSRKEHGNQLKPMLQKYERFRKCVLRCFAKGLSIKSGEHQQFGALEWEDGGNIFWGS